MAVVLGKRKRQSSEKKTNVREIESSDDDVRARFQKAFEAKFKPLPKAAIPAPSVGEEDEEYSEGDEDQSDWEGLSDEGDSTVVVVDHVVNHEVDRAEQKKQIKAFMSSKPPSSIDTLFAAATKQKKPTPADDTDEPENANLQNDLALQRLLKESHLLDPTTVSSSNSYVPEGKSRIRALDLRIQGLGAKKAILEQEKMPMAFRKGIVSKAAEREAKRRKEAAENGIILERARASVKGSEKKPRKQKFGGGPGVGRFQGATLRLGKKDVREIQGAKKGAGGKDIKGRL